MIKGSKFSRALVYTILLIVGGSLYVGIEFLWRGYSHYTMFIVGGICFILVGTLNEIIQEPMSLFLQGCIGSLIITCIEFITGCIVNLYLGLNVWDYSDMPLNILGQICIPFTIAWILLSMVCVLLNDILLVCFGIRKSLPEYKLF